MHTVFVEGVGAVPIVIWGLVYVAVVSNLGALGLPEKVRDFGGCSIALSGGFGRGGSCRIRSHPIWGLGEWSTSV